METTLHRALKARYGPEAGGRQEVVLHGFRIDAVDPDGSLVEIQSGPLGPLRGKLSRLLAEHRIRVVKPVVVSKRVVRRAHRDAPDLSARMSPKRGSSLDVFEDLIGVIALFPHPHLRIDVMEVAIDEVRVSRRRWPGFAVADRRLREVGAVTHLVEPRDLWRLIPSRMPDRFTTADLARGLGRSMPFAQKVAYCLREAGASQITGKEGNRLVYKRMDA